MKSGIHPKYMECKVTCACGNSFETRATVAALKIDICNVCHPFYTGKQKFVDSAGRVQRFRERYGDYRKNRGAPAQTTEAAAEAAPAPDASTSDES